jgi:hypothetical protein
MRRTVPSLPLKDAEDRARAALGLNPSVSARARYVRRLDQRGADYFLVTLGAETATVGIVILDARTGELQNSVTLPGLRGHFEINEEQARKKAGGGTSAELVWRPSAASLSPLYPVWEVRKEEGFVYVDQKGSVWTSLQEAGRGGAPRRNPGGSGRPPADD